MAKRDFDLETRQKVFDYIVRHKQGNDGAAPTIREISEACNISSTAHIKFLLDSMEEMGMIDRGNGARMISVPGGRWTYDPESVVG